MYLKLGVFVWFVGLYFVDICIYKLENENFVIFLNYLVCNKGGFIFLCYVKVILVKILKVCLVFIFLWIKNFIYFCKSSLENK